MANAVKEFRIRARDGLWLSCALFDREHPKAVVQILHGAREYKKRYYDFAGFLWEQGYAVILSDIRGHGESVNAKWPLGHMDGVGLLVNDLHRITHYVQKHYPGVPIMLFGHSFGSLLARAMLQRRDGWYQKLVMTGTVPYIRLVRPMAVLLRIAGLIAEHFGFDLLLNLMIRHSSLSWVCSVERYREDYRRDHFMRDSEYDTDAYWTLAMADYEMHRYHWYHCDHPELQILSATGKDDPVTGGGPGLFDTVHTLRRIGYQQVRSVRYPGMRHEVLHEKGHEKVYRDILDFLDGSVLDESEISKNLR